MIKNNISHNINGFTLVEVIVSLIIGSILATMLVSYNVTTLEKSSKPTINTIKSQKMSMCLDCIVGKYRSSFYESGDSIYDVNELVSVLDEPPISSACSGLNVTTEEVGYSSDLNSFVADSNGGMIRVIVSGDSGLIYSMIFSSK